MTLELTVGILPRKRSALFSFRMRWRFHHIKRSITRLTCMLLERLANEIQKSHRQPIVSKLEVVQTEKASVLKVDLHLHRDTNKSDPESEDAVQTVHNDGSLKPLCHL